MTRKIKVHRWQLDAIRRVLLNGQRHLDPGLPLEVEHWIDDALDMQIIEPKGDGYPTVYVFFGTRKGADEWLSRRKDVSRSSLVLAVEPYKLEGGRARVRPVYTDLFWLGLNCNHPLVLQTQDIIYELESKFGTGVGSRGGD